MYTEKNERAENIAKDIQSLALKLDPTLSINNRVAIASASYIIDILHDLEDNVLSLSIDMENVIVELQKIDRQIYFKN
jgi:hypothetical protein